MLTRALGAVKRSILFIVVPCVLRRYPVSASSMSRVGTPNWGYVGDYWPLLGDIVSTEPILKRLEAPVVVPRMGEDEVIGQLPWVEVSELPRPEMD